MGIILDRAMKEIRELLNKHGIDSALIILDDPDEPSFSWHREGKSTWAIGAARIIISELEHAYHAQGHETDVE